MSTEVRSQAQILIDNCNALVSKCGGDPVSEHFADCCIIVLGNNHHWGKAATLSAALALAKKPKAWVAYIAKLETTVSEVDGALSWARGFAPRKIASQGM